MNVIFILRTVFFVSISSRVYTNTKYLIQKCTIRSFVVNEGEDEEKNVHYERFSAAYETGGLRVEYEYLNFDAYQGCQPGMRNKGRCPIRSICTADCLANPKTGECVSSNRGVCAVYFQGFINECSCTRMGSEDDPDPLPKTRFDIPSLQEKGHHVIDLSAIIRKDSKLLDVVVSNISGEPINDVFRCLSVPKCKIDPEYELWTIGKQIYPVFILNVLLKWVEMEGNGATVLKLFEALNEAGFNDVIEQLSNTT